MIHETAARSGPLLFLLVGRGLQIALLAAGGQARTEDDGHDENDEKAHHDTLFRNAAICSRTRVGAVPP